MIITKQHGVSEVDGVSVSSFSFKIQHGNHGRIYVKRYKQTQCQKEFGPKYFVAIRKFNA